MTTIAVPATEAIVLKRIPFGDTSLVAHLFCEDRGRAAILVKGAFREKGAYLGAFDLLDRMEVAMVARKPGTLGSPVAARTLDNHRRLRTRRDALAAALYTSELLDLALTETPQRELFESVKLWLAWLDKPEAPEPRDVALRLLAFEFQFLRQLGLQPNLESCASCAGPLDFPSGESPSAEVPYSVAAGGVLCARCAARHSGARRFSGPALSLANRLRGGETPAPTDPGAARELRRFLDLFHKFYLDYSPRSRPSIEHLWH